MSGSLNLVQIIGNLGRDPEVRRLSSGSPVVNMSVAVTESWRDKSSGERKERTEWVRVVCFNENLCKIAEQYLRKGSKIYVSGAMQTRKWTDKDGVEKYSTEVVLQGFNGQIIMLDGKDGSAGGGERPAQAQTQSAYQPAAQEEDTVPF